MISVIIPINERYDIKTLVAYVLDNSTDDYVKEIIVVDCHNSQYANGVSELSSKVKHVYTDHCTSKQYNIGAKMASSEVLYFIHPGCLPPKSFDVDIVSAINGGSDAGSFKIKFSKSHPLLSVVEWISSYTSTWCEGIKQSLFIKKSTFQALGGFDQKIKYLQDVEFLRRLTKNYSFTILAKEVTLPVSKQTEKNVFSGFVNHMRLLFMYRTGSCQADLGEVFEKR